MKTHVWILLSLLSLSLTPDALADGIRLGNPEYGGSGCPGGSASVALSPDQSAISILFDQYVVEAGGAKAFDRHFDLGETHPLGALGDCQLAEAAGGTNCDFNSVWDVRTGRFEGGWTAEFKIPFKTIRYQPGKDQLWGVNFRRMVRWKNELTFLSQVPITWGRRGLSKVSSAGTLVGIQAPTHLRNLDIKPYATTDLTSDMVRRPARRNANVGPCRFGYDIGKL